MTISRSDQPAGVIRIVAAVVGDDTGRTLLVRKRGTEAFMQPGGKLSPGEPPLAALAREMDEELGCGLDLGSCKSMGIFAAPAANEAGFTVEAELYQASLIGSIQARNEIEEFVWLDPDAEASVLLAPLTALHAMPIARGWKTRLRSAAR